MADVDGEARTRAVGVPCENPVPTGCSIYKMLERFVQLNSFWVGLACPYDHVKGCNFYHYFEHSYLAVSKFNSPVYLERAFQRATAWPAVRPDGV